MVRYEHINRLIATSGSILLACIVLCVVATAATIVWDGSEGDSWQDGDNWVGGSAPGSTDTAEINGSGFDSIRLYGNTPGVDGLELTGNDTLRTNGYRLLVDNGVDAETLVSSGARLSVTPYAADPSNRAFDTDILTLTNSGLLRVFDARVDVDSSASVSATSSIVGYGEILFGQPGTPEGTVVLSNNGTIGVHTLGAAVPTTLTLTALGNGELDLDGTGGNGILAVDDDAIDGGQLTLIFDGPLADGFGGVLNIGHRDTANFLDPWQALQGEIVFNGFNDTATLTGGHLQATATDITVRTGPSSVGFIENDLGFVSGTVTVENDATLRLGGAAAFGSAAVLNFASGSTLDVDHTLQVDGNATIAFGAMLELDNADGIVVNGDFNVHQTVIDLDGNSGVLEITVNQGAEFYLDADTIDNDGVSSFGGTINIHSGGNFHASVNGTWECDGRINIDTTDGDANLNRAHPGIAVLTVDGGEATDGIYVTGDGGTAVIKGRTAFTSNARVDVAQDSELQLYTWTSDGAPWATDIRGGTWTGGGTLLIDSEMTLVTADTTMNTSVVDLDGRIRNSGSGHTLRLQSELTLRVNSINSGNDNRYAGIGEVLEIYPTGRLDVQFNNLADSWVMDATMDLYGFVGVSTSHHLDGADVELRGVTNVSGNSEWTARALITGDVNIAANGKAILNGGNWVDRNRLQGGTIDGPGKLAMSGVRALEGYGTINAPIEFTGDVTRLTATDGILAINDPILDVGIIGTLSSTGTLLVTSPWNTGVVHTRVENNGGKITGAEITNDGLIEGGGSITADGLINNGTVSASLGTLVLDSATDAYDLDGVANDGVLNAVNGSLDIREGDVTFGGTLNVATGWSFLVDEHLSLWDPTGPGMVHLAGGTISAGMGISSGETIVVDTAPAVLQAGREIHFHPASHTTINNDLTLDSNYRTLFHSGATIAGSGRLINPRNKSILLYDGIDTDVAVHDEGGFSLGGGELASVRVGQLTLVPGSDWSLSVFGPNASDVDWLGVDTTATLNGRLSVWRGPLDGEAYEPSAGESWVILDADGDISGQFDLIDSRSGPLADRLFWHLEYDTLDDRVVLHVLEALDADFNEDGNVDDTDLAIWEWGFGRSSEASHGHGDANRDGAVNGTDYLIWQRQYGTSVLPVLAAGGKTTVPEPATVFLFVISNLIMVCQKRTYTAKDDTGWEKLL